MSVILNSFDFKITKFPAGEVNVQVGKFHGVNAPKVLHFILKYEGNDDLFTLALIVDAAKRKYQNIPTKLTMLYIPYARQDRVCNEGESLSIRVLCDFINSLHFDEVVVADAHSDVSLALLNNVNQLDLLDCFKQSLTIKSDNFAFISPDS